MFEKMKSGLALFNAGKSLEQSVMAKQGQVTLAAVTVFMSAALATVHAFGYGANIDEQSLLAFGGLAVGVINWLLTVASTDKIGLSGQSSSPVMPANHYPSINTMPVVTGADGGPAPVGDALDTAGRG